MTMAQGFATWLTTLPNLLTDVIIALLILLGSIIISSWLGRAVETAARRRQADLALAQTLSRLTRWTVLIFGFVLALEQVVPNVTSLLAGLGIAGFTLGFALQDVAKNFIAGLLLLLQRPFEIGDTILVTGFTGEVLDITLRTTDLRTIDGLFVTIPNGDVIVSPITNFSRAPERRFEIKAGVSYDADSEQVERIALEAVREVPGFIENPPPQVVFDSLGDSAVNISIVYWADMGRVDYVVAKDAGIKLVKSAFTREGIDMPFPTMAIVRPTSA